MRGSVNNQVNQLWSKIDGLYTSKGETRANSDYRGHNGHKVSENVHGYSWKDETKRIAKELLTYSKKNFKIKDMQAITGEVVLAYVNDKIEDGLVRNSISSYISNIAKIKVGLSKIPNKLKSHNNQFTHEDLKQARKNINQFAVRSKHINRAYINPASFKSDMSIKSRIGYQLQLKHGLRVSEATLIRPSQLLNNNTIRIQGKGGYERDVKLSSVLFNQITQEIKAHGSYYQGYNTYLKDLKNSVAKAGEKWTGTHGLRYNYAQSQMSRYQEKMSYKEALARVSFELGHHRIEITKHYLK
ncbi:site-specific integrase [Sulfurimonas autotrophica]|uniref:Tyr recombinase domain-containing protein n=1 Tax=Sulfurimonas autotrophica (strain ATCC BAA-671 / DSM 16294 / JCM 11897 / OK10) TaxID=563040 RepID=E0UTC8_SULAO|nr:site-specific integrase [Sulfurimonas autotrophica]ADN08231.1 hypothetical protein Saut_0182 [Sulfurimonas autotrophica DSM 16294]